MQHTVRSATLVAAVSAASLLTACDAGGDIMAPLALPTSQVNGAQPQAVSAQPQQGHPGELDLTSQQHLYLDKLKDTGINPSSELLALSIGSYVCQAHAAKLNDQAVRDFVLPLVRSDVRAAHTSESPTSGEIDAAATDYIRIATEHLC
ncbi:hypothetical protein B7435_24495 [Mycolicibacterium peregrinum]|uniref:hypothetical protein n=1 Tax=Mycolicibacterium peregrinum TaxID=43304 RepID=UPI0006D7DE76|nr:hypothetical protein [Mycolicibacterium peregrinum]MCV7204842.1 hypothetical protein [Mycolicibacterium peregrinum]ORW59609.1 hypothetical protein AWC21_12755 [Mycolicibacterium peregrinum]OWL98744.1 hypothetical protein B7435_24495 [Mycolicibacterium peregrinum]